MNITRRNFLGASALAGAAFLAPGCCSSCCGTRYGKVALQLYSLKDYIGGDKKLKTKGVGLEKGLADVRAIGFEGVEFAGYYGFKPCELKKMLADNGLKVCGTHVSNDQYGFDVKKGTFNPDVLKKTCAFETGYGNTLIICPGGGNFPKKGENLDDFLKMLVDYYNTAAEEAAKYGCKIGLHNHTGEFTLKMKDGTTYWDYFFSNTHKNVCMEQDVGWTTCAGHDPCEQYRKYPHRSPTLHAKENGMGGDVKQFDGILGQPGRDANGKVCAKGVDWDKLAVAADADGVKWWVVECERHFDTLEAITPSFAFLKSKGRC